jgi:uridine phosphorylase
MMGRSTVGGLVAGAAVLCNQHTPSHAAEAAEFVPHHISATSADLKGNGKVGRYFFIPGSNARAAVIAKNFKNVRVLKSSRGHDIHLGTLNGVEVAAVSTGMGCPSVDIIVTELIKLGAKRFIRVGTAGSMQPHEIRVGSVVVGTGAVRDEGTSKHYAPMEFPAMASPMFVRALEEAAKQLDMADTTYLGLIHSKDSLYAREFKEGAYGSGGEHKRYMDVLESLGVVASEMEASMLFTLANVHGNQVKKVSQLSTSEEISCACVCAIIGDDSPFADPAKQGRAVEAAIELALKAVCVLAEMEKSQNE